MSTWQDWIGRSVEAEDQLTPGLITRLRAAIDSETQGDVAPQGIHWCLCLPDASTSALGADGHPVRDETPGSFMPPVPVPRRMWASSEVHFHAPIRRDAAIARTSTIASVKEKNGSTGNLVFVEVDHQTHADSQLAVEERQTIVFREATQAPVQPAPAAINVNLSDWQWHRTLHPSETLLFRYSALTFNTHRIHYDRPYAMDVEGYRGLVVHGPLTATLLLDLAAGALGANALKRFSFRGQSPAIAGESLHLVGKAEGSDVTLAALGSDGRTVMAAKGER